jgi:hypothetical protein
MKVSIRLITAVSMIVVLSAIISFNWSIFRPLNSTSPVVESPAVESEKTTRTANRLSGWSAPKEFTASPHAAAPGGLSKEDAENEREKSRDIDAESAEPEMPQELTEAQIVLALQSLTADEANRSMLGNLTQQWATRNYSAALAWAMEYVAGEARDGLIQRIAFVRVQDWPFDAAQLVVQEIPPGPVQDEAAITVLHQWALKDQVGADAWVQRFPEGELRERAERELQGLQQFR